MAKVSFNKLQLKKVNDVKTFQWEEEIIEVKQYLPIQDKLELLTKVINMALDSSSKYYNPAQLSVLLDFELIQTYTNVNFTEKQKEEYLKNYDLMLSNGFIASVKAHMGPELKMIEKWLYECLQHIYEYNNSIMGILENSQANYDNLNLDASEIQSKLADPDNLAFLKQIAPLMNLA